jgi:hypothetical protein
MSLVAHRSSAPGAALGGDPAPRIARRALFCAPFAFEGVWQKIGPILAEWQAAVGDPAVWENVARLGKRYEVWSATTWRPKLEAVSVEHGRE